MQEELLCRERIENMQEEEELLRLLLILIYADTKNGGKTKRMAEMEGVFFFFDMSTQEEGGQLCTLTLIDAELQIELVTTRRGRGIRFIRCDPN
jgi:hypothetical protein